MLNKLIKNDAWPFILVIAFGLITFGSYLYFPTFLGYDSYFFLDGVCGEGINYNQATISTVPPLAKVVFNALSCDVFLIKTLFVGLFTISLLIIYYINRLEHGKDAWMAIPFVLIFPVFILNSLKIENDPLGYPFMFASFYFFFKYLKSKHNNLESNLGPVKFIGFKKDYTALALSLILIFIATLFWGGSLYYLLYYSLLQPWLLLLTIPLLMFFFAELTQPIIPNFAVDENNPFRFVRQVIMFFTIFLLSARIDSIPKKKWLLALPFLIMGLLSSNLLILLTLLIPLLLIHAWKNAEPLTKDWMVRLAFVVSLIYIIQIGISWHCPYSYEHDLVQEAIDLATDQNVILENDWGLGHLVFYYGGLTTKHSGISEITCSDCIVLSYDEFPNCELLEEEEELKLYNC